MKRRDLLKASAASLSYLSLPSMASAAIKTQNKKLVWIVLRGGMDGLHSTIPLFDPNLMSLREDLVKHIKNKSLPIDRGFALHPELKFMHRLYKAKQLNTVVATATPYRRRSHFTGQDILESGLTTPDLDNGWLARVLTQINIENKQKELGLAVARSLPVSMRGSNHAMTWYPSKLETSDEDFHNRLMQLYEYDESLTLRLEQALKIQELIGGMKQSKKRGKLKNLVSSCATLMSEPSGPDIAMIEVNGWDTHNRQVSRMNSKLIELDQSIEALHDGLANQWQDTLLIIATEFGRTVKINGTGGTDHGTATSLFIGGGAVKGGNVLGDWPGLSKDQLYEERDLQPTSDMFSWIASATAQHFNFSRKQTAQIFPDTKLKNINFT